MPAFIQQKPTSLSVTDTNAEICLNTWFFVDSTGMVIRIAAKAYALKGTDEEKLAILKSLAGTDHLSATHGRIPKRYVTTNDGLQLPVARHQAVFVAENPKVVLQSRVHLGLCCFCVLGQIVEAI